MGLEWHVPSETGQIVSKHYFAWDGTFLDGGVIKEGSQWIGASYAADLGHEIDRSLHIVPRGDHIHHVVHSDPGEACPCKATLLPLPGREDDAVYWQHWPMNLSDYQDPYDFLTAGCPDG